jgi:hypothetical protein
LFCKKKIRAWGWRPSLGTQGTASTAPFHLRAKGWDTKRRKGFLPHSRSKKNEQWEITPGWVAGRTWQALPCPRWTPPARGREALRNPEAGPELPAAAGALGPSQKFTPCGAGPGRLGTRGSHAARSAGSWSPRGCLRPPGSLPWGGRPQGPALGREDCRWRDPHLPPSPIAMPAPRPGLRCGSLRPGVVPTPPAAGATGAGGSAIGSHGSGTPDGAAAPAQSHVPGRATWRRGGRGGSGRRAGGCRVSVPTGTGGSRAHLSRTPRGSCAGQGRGRGQRRWRALTSRWAGAPQPGRRGASSEARGEGAARNGGAGRAALSLALTPPAGSSSRVPAPPASSPPPPPPPPPPQPPARRAPPGRSPRARRATRASA